MRSSALSRSGFTTLASSAPGVTHWPSSSGSSERTPSSGDFTFIESTCFWRKETTALRRSICASCARTWSRRLPFITSSRCASICMRFCSSCALSICWFNSTSERTPFRFLNASALRFASASSVWRVAMVDCCASSWVLRVLRRLMRSARAWASCLSASSAWSITSGLESSMSVVPASMRAPGRSGSRSMRPAVSAVIQRICSGTRLPGPFT